MYSRLFRNDTSRIHAQDKITSGNRDQTLRVKKAHSCMILSVNEGWLSQKSWFDVEWERD